MSAKTAENDSGTSKTLAAPQCCIIGGGIKVEFPPDIKPYKCQLTLMSKAVTGARKAQNCLLESPTGSGKTMAMLCSLLAWQKTIMDEAREAEQAAMIQAQTNSVNTLDERGDPEILYVSEINHSDTSPKNGGKKNRMQFMDDWSTCESATSVLSQDLSRSMSPDMFGEDDMEDFKPPKKKFQTRPLTEKNNIVLGPSTSSACNTSLNNKEAVNLNDSTPTATPEANKAPRIRIPKIFFATRTHKQITQVIKEFRRTPYRNARMTVLGSREQTCIRQLEPPYQNKNEMCRTLLEMSANANERRSTSKPGCLFKRNLDRVSSNASLLESYMNLESPWDIEDLVQAGTKKHMCPYFATKTLLARAQIVFCPYNYLVDPGIRKSTGISLKDNIIIFDEAHNIEDSMREAVSLSIHENKLDQAITECGKIIAMGGGASYTYLQNTFQSLLNWMREMSEKLQKENAISNERSCTLTGTAYIAHMDTKGIGISAFEKYVEAVESVFDEPSQNSQEEEDVEDPRNREDNVKIHQLYKPSQDLKTVATGLVLVWSYLFHKDYKHAEDYTVVLIEQATRFFAEDATSDGWIGNPKVSAKVHLILNFWCMNPAVAFADFSETHSVIVTSGTLSPMGSFQSELGVMFPHHLSTDHVIDPSQAWVAAVASGPNGKEINGRYQNAITMEYQDEVGDSILQICQAVPFGVLCFFPSYSMLENVVRRWQCTGKWQKLLACKYVIKEPRRVGEFSDAMHNYDLAVRKAEMLYARGAGLPYGEQTGALCLAVFRGKLSEGIDFKDNHARAVIAVGIPFPSMSDLQVKLKRKYNDTHHLRTKHLLPGSQWYEIQAYRAINQALGRCVRHRHDWGAIILLDSRFAPGSKAAASLSKWATKEMKHYSSFRAMYPDLQQFMKTKSGISMTKEEEIETFYID